MSSKTVKLVMVRQAVAFYRQGAREANSANICQPNLRAKTRSIKFLRGDM
jgi:hypothetical protein